MRRVLSYRACLALDPIDRHAYETHYVNVLEGQSGATDAQLANIAIAFVSPSGGVVGSSDYLVVPNGTYPGPASPNNTVQINSGRAYVPNLTTPLTMMYSTYHDTYTSSGTNVTISPNSSGNPRIDAVVLYLNLAASPNAQATNVAGFADVAGTPAASPSAPNNSQILAAIGSGNPYIVLAYVSVANGFTSISSGNITDERSFASFTTGNVVPIPSYEEFTNQSSSPASPASGKLRVYSKNDNNLYSKTSAGVETAIGADTTFEGAFANWVASGLTVPTSGSLSTTVASGVAYYAGIKYSVATDGGHTYTASKDTYVDVNPASGAYTYTAVANGATAPALTASSIRIARVVTSGGAVTSVAQLGADSLGTTIYPASPLAAKSFTGTRMDAVSVTNSTTESISDSTVTALTFDTNNWDTNSLHSTSVNTSRITVPSGGDGKWLFGASVPFASNSTGNRGLSFKKNGTTFLGGAGIQAGANEATVVSATTQANLSAGDYVEVYVLQKSGGALSVATSTFQGAVLECWAMGPLRP